MITPDPSLVMTLLSDVSFLKITSALIAVIIGWAIYHHNKRKHHSSQYLNELMQTIDLQGDGVYICDIHGNLLMANRALVEMGGFRNKREYVEYYRKKPTEWYVDSSRREAFCTELFSSGKVNSFKSETYSVDRKAKCWVSEDAWLIRDEKGNPVRYAGTVRDITMLEQNRLLEDQLEKLADNLPGGLFKCRTAPDGFFQVLYTSRVFRSMLGLDSNYSAITPTHFLERVHPDDRSRYREAMENALTSGKRIDLDLRILEPDNGAFGNPVSADAVKWVNMSATGHQDVDGGMLWYGFLADVDTRKRTEANIERLAYHDALTDLPNRRYFTMRMEQAIASCSRRKASAALLYMDLDEFKALNDNRGHEMGDELLQLVAKRLKAITRINDTVARLGGDEFVILLEDIGIDQETAIENAINVAEKVLKDFGNGFELSDGHFASTPSIGIRIFSGIDQSVDMVIRDADTAMYLAKRAGRNTFRLHEADEENGPLSNHDLAAEFKSAISKQQLRLFIQPQLDRDGNISGGEALVRWAHPELGILSPAIFMPIAERGGMMNEINGWVLEEACRILDSWKNIDLTSKLTLSVNISEQKFSGTGLVEELTALFARYHFERNKLAMEVTEKTLARRPDTIASHMHDLKQLGIRFSLDDFGTGHSSLTQLNRFPLDEVKIDGAFVSRIESSESNRTLIEGILGMAKALQLKTVAEHVSSAYQQEFLRHRGCQKFQGYYHYPPLAHEEFLLALDENKTAKPALVHHLRSA